MKRMISWMTAAMVLAMIATPASAYVGPGAGLSLLGALWGLILAVVAALAFVALWPLRHYRRKARQRRSQAVPVDTGATTARPGTRTGDQQSPAKRQAR